MTPDEMTTEQLEQRVRSLGEWFHNLDLKGVRTAPHHFLGDFPTVFWNRFQHAFPTDLKGKSVLDIGCNGGFYSIEMKRRGAARVVGIDSDERYLAQARFATQVLGVDVELLQMNVYDVGALGEKFDIVLFMGVFYHLRHPLLALDLLYEHVVKELLIFQTLERGSDEVGELARDYPISERAIFDRPEYPKMHFIEYRYAGDWTNWWAPNRACTEAMLRAAGFDLLEHPSREVYICRRGQRPTAWGAVYPRHPESVQ
ncbi:methyltransferase, TIGR04290 family [Cystobacter ferrugineus]|uniref:Methyltransferase, TIGR04290 family n=2 Tax=Cystobacter ferrugineus TaxID=83449 RepID=A0A1L9BKV2_9BACT|nr:methyltransferase, TIGR04290 family [Cystobacter ferrugineus]